LTLISGDASFRRYFRGGGLVWVDANPKTEKIMNLSAMPPPCTLGAAGPEVKGVDYEQGLLAVTDLGIPSLSAA
jgi:aminoglycoside/choline kinase family phosphotransferase